MRDISVKLVRKGHYTVSVMGDKRKHVMSKLSELPYVNSTFAWINNKTEIDISLSPLAEKEDIDEMKQVIETAIS